MQEVTSYKDIVEFIATLPGSYPDISVKKMRGLIINEYPGLKKEDPIDKKVEAIVMAKEVSYIFDKWNVSKPDRAKLIELLINIKALQ